MSLSPVSPHLLIAGQVKIAVSGNEDDFRKLTTGQALCCQEVTSATYYEGRLGRREGGTRPSNIKAAIESAEQNSLKIADWDTFLARLKVNFAVWTVLDGYYGRRKAKSEEFARDQRGHAAGEYFIQTVTPCKDDVVCFGSGYKGCSAQKGMTYTPVLKCVKRKLAQQRRVLDINEHLTSQRCPWCHSIMKDTGELPPARLRCAATDSMRTRCALSPSQESIGPRSAPTVGSLLTVM